MAFFYTHYENNRLILQFCQDKMKKKPKKPLKAAFMELLLLFLVNNSIKICFFLLKYYIII